MNKSLSTPDLTTSAAHAGAGFADDDEPALLHEDVAQMLSDATGCFRAVCVLGALLRADSPDNLDAGDRIGLAVLLEGVRHRLEMTVDGLSAAAVAMGLQTERVVLQ